MGISEKLQIEGGLETEGMKWVIAGIPIRAPLKQIRTKKMSKDFESEEELHEERPTTPTAEETRIPERLLCPPAPRKRRPASKCNFNGVREFFNPPDLESVFIRHVERAN